MQQLDGVKIRTLPANGPMKVRAGNAACRTAQSEAVTGGYALAFAHIDAAEVHREREESHSVIDDDAVAFVIERPGEHYDAAIAGAHGSAGGGAEVRTLVYAGELAVEHAAGSKAVSGLGRDRGVKAAVPERLGRRSCKYFGLEPALCLDLFHCRGIGFNEFRRDAERAGAVMSGAHFDGSREIAYRPVAHVGFDIERRGAWRRFDIDTGKGIPGVLVPAHKELKLMGLPYALEGGRAGDLDPNEFRRARLDDGGCKNHARKRRSGLALREGDGQDEGDEQQNRARAGHAFSIPALRTKAEMCSCGLFVSVDFVVLLAVDLTAGAVLLTIDLAAFLTGKLATVGGTIGSDLLVDSLLAILGACRFTGGH